MSAAFDLCVRHTEEMAQSEPGGTPDRRAPGVLPADTRGIVSPARMMRQVHFDRYPVSASLTGLVDWFWSVRWDLTDSETFRQDVVSHPGVNLSVGSAPPPGVEPPPGPYPVRVVVNGVSTDLSTRVLSGSGWNVAAKTTTGGFGAWADDVSAWTDRMVPVADVLPGWDVGLIDQIDPSDLAGAARLLDAELVRLLAARERDRVATARRVSSVARRAEVDRSISRVEQLAAVAGVSPRTLQRLFSAYAGVSPTWVIRRYRLIDAAEIAKEGGRVDWAGVAADLGYADQAHLTRDFTATIGVAPATYASAQG